MRGARIEGLDPQWRELFLLHFAESLNIHQACVFAGIPRWHAYNERERNEEFRQQWEAARTAAIERAEAEAYRRAVEGWHEPVFYQGEEVGQVRRYSDQLLIKLLSAHDKRWRADAQVQVNGDATKVYVSVSPDEL